MVLLTGSSVQATIGAKLCFLGMPRLQCSLWEVLVSCPRAKQVWAPSWHGAGCQGKWAVLCWQLCTWHSMAEHRQAPWLLLSCIFLVASYPHPSPTAAGAASDSTRAVPALPPPPANRPCGSVNTLSAFIWAAGAGIAHPFVPRNTCGIWIQQFPALFLKQMLLAGSFAYPVYENQGELLLLLLNRKRRP